MSDTYLVLIPTDPRFTPSPEAAQEAVTYLKKLRPKASEVIAEPRDQVEFIDNGENLQSVHCPQTGKEIASKTWVKLMNEAWKTKFADLTCDCPACGAMHSLNDLTYEMPVGFARFSLEAMNPFDGDLSDDELGEFERILGCPLRVIWRHV